MSDQSIKSQKRNKSLIDTSYFTVMIAKGLGRVRTYHISSRILFWSSLFIILYLAGSAVLIKRYFSELRTNAIEADLLAQVQHEIEGTKQELFQARRRLRILEDQAPGQQTADKKEAKHVAPKTVNQGPASLGIEKEPPETNGKITGQRVDIRRLTFRRDGATLRVQFRLVNVTPNRKTLRGYILMIAVNSRTDPPQVWTYPKVALRDGAPVSHTSCQAFKVNNYRIIRGRYFISSPDDSPSSLKILVYDKSGQLLLKKEFNTEKGW